MTDQIIRRWLRNALIFTGLLVVAYLISAFLAWDFNPGNWEDGGRFMSVLTGVALSALATWRADEILGEVNKEQAESISNDQDV